ncbi:type VII secretion protein EccE [Mycobacterium decipiens]|uniref:Type VII secretion protein EccE n=2 Tax=Mycobacterium decipiens TaxID=1430326 RepID=A0A1X2LWL9_9MYCO|nr:type VII secretion protein EccE [Mycobacterium decipiens]
MACPWRSPHDQRVLGVGAVVAIVLFSWWRGLHLTTILHRRLAMVRRQRRMTRQHRRPATEARIDAKATALLRIRPLTAGTDWLPLPVIAGYLNRYGIRADKIRITNRDIGTDRRTWIGLTVSAADNLTALQARSPCFPLRETTQVAARRLADHLREIGWAVSMAGPDDIPPLLGRSAHETWRGVQRHIVQGIGDYVAAYRINVDDALPDTLAAIRSHPAREIWTVLEIARGGTGRTLAAACAVRTGARLGGTVSPAGLIPHDGNHRSALMALNPLSTQWLDGHTNPPSDLLGRLRWPAPRCMVAVPARNHGQNARPRSA